MPWQRHANQRDRKGGHNGKEGVRGRHGGKISRARRRSDERVADK